MANASCNSRTTQCEPPTTQRLQHNNPMSMLVVSPLTRKLKSEPRSAYIPTCQTYQAMTVFTSTLTAIAQLLTIYKVIYRHVMRRFKWEDACTVVALIGSVICVVTSWTQFELGECVCLIYPCSVSIHPTHPAGKPSVISLWIYALTYPSVVWSVVPLLPLRI